MDTQSDVVYVQPPQPYDPQAQAAYGQYYQPQPVPGGAYVPPQPYAQNGEVYVVTNQQYPQQYYQPQPVPVQQQQTTTTTTTTNAPPVAPQVVVVQQVVQKNDDANCSWWLFCGGWFFFSLLCWIPGAWIGLRSKNPEARLPGILNAVFSVLSVISIIIVVIYMVAFYRALTGQ
eukprot:TRINITY_DN2422_c0_g1_i1.p2 TRINITY_DN2422_c0_g1~~TRINITY_DN2422_c0_g1_i1.p2  ORF type:complete len:187 (+),score=11.76 TRINITY_DN2422_c0_g1_i1:42-563(+)